MSALAAGWDDALAAAALIAIDPNGLGGVVVRGPPSSTRDAWLEAMRTVFPPLAPFKRFSPNIDDDQLLGGVDLAATLAAGKPLMRKGVLSACAGGVLVLTMAERCSPALAARLSAALDGFGREDGADLAPTIVAFDEGVEDEIAPAALRERLAFQIDLTGVRADARRLEAELIDLARRRLAAMPGMAERDIETVCNACSRFDIGSARAPLFALRAARAAAALNAREVPSEEDWALAARLVLSPRALGVDADAGEPPPAEDNSAATQPETNDGAATTERLVQAVRSALPAGFLDDAFAQRRQRAQAKQGGVGAAAKSARRGRPVGSSPGALHANDRLDLVATLRAASVWQPLRQRAQSRATARVLVRREDFRIRRYAQRLESSIVFAVDASGSTALQRLAEAKGAVETLLADAYVTRAHVALIVFRERQAKLALAPTRSLTRAKRMLAELPGGGATPLASALDAASLLAQSERGRGRSPLVVVLSDGRGNVDRAGEASRDSALHDAQMAGRALNAAGIASVFIDTSQRPRAEAQGLAAAMGARYALLPHIDARAVAEIVKSQAR